MQFSTVATISALAATSLAAYSNGTVVTTDITVTGYTTYCPESTVITITKCDEVCKPTVITVSEATTITITEPCVIPGTTEPKPTTTESKPETTTQPKTVQPKSETTSTTSTKPPVVASSFTGAGVKNAAGVVAGVAAVAAALL